MIGSLSRALLLPGRRPRRRPSAARVLALWLPSGLVVGLVLLTPVYLLVRALEADERAGAVLLRPVTLEILARSGLLAVSVTGTALVLGTGLGWLVVRTDLPLRRIWTVLLALPLVIPSYVAAYLVVAALGPRGLIQQLLHPLIGIPRLPDIYGFPGAFLVLSLLTYPYVLLPVRAALRGSDPALEEASRSLGHGSWATFRRVTLPQLRPAMTAGALLVALYTLRDFGTVSLMRYTTFTRALYVQYQSSFDRSTAAALALVLMAITLSILALEQRSRGQGAYYAKDGNPRRLPAPIGLGPLRWPALVVCAAVATLALFLPAGVLSYWLVRGVTAGESVAPLWNAARNSLLASGLAAAATVAAVVPVAVLGVRRPGRLTSFVEHVAYSGFALPGLVVALALVFFGTRVAPFVYQTLPMLIAAYAILFLPQALGPIRATLLQIPPSLEEASRSLGRTPLRAYREVVLPLLRPGILAGAALVFLTTMKELQATLILAPYGFRTLAVEVWSAVAEAFFARAAAPALLIIAASSLPMAYLLLRQEGRHGR